MATFIVVYAELITGRNMSRIRLNATRFGGISNDMWDAERQARECVNTTSNGKRIIIPRVVMIDAECGVIDAMIEWDGKFRKMVDDMEESRGIMAWLRPGGRI